MASLLERLLVRNAKNKTHMCHSMVELVKIVGDLSLSNVFSSQIWMGEVERKLEKLEPKADELLKTLLNSVKRTRQQRLRGIKWLV